MIGNKDAYKIDIIKNYNPCSFFLYPGNLYLFFSYLRNNVSVNIAL